MRGASAIMTEGTKEENVDVKLHPDGDNEDSEFIDFQAVIARFETPLLRYVGQMLGPFTPAAEDVVQETFLRLHNQVSSKGLASVRNMPNWLFRVAHNLTLDAIRKKERDRKLHEQAVEEARNDPAPAQETLEGVEGLMHRETCRKVLEELQKLPKEQKQVLLLRVIQDFKFKEISEITGLSVGNVAYRINQGLRELADRLKAAGVM
jgi:RNA polymerase sigma-70 factor (ECF subfamily)